MRTSCKTLFACLASIALCVALASCASAAEAPAAADSLGAYPAADMSSYDCAEGYSGSYRFVDMTVAEVAAEMDAGNSFVVYAGYDHCPWCNAILNHLNDIAAERGISIGYLNTRRDSSWMSNTDMDDYDLFVERFGDALPLDDDGKKHLYVPHVFFVGDGKLVHDHPGTVSSQQASSDPLTEEQIEEYRNIIGGYLDDIGL